MMRQLDAFPPNAAGGSCFLNRANYTGGCVDTGMVNDYDTPLPYGKICISVKTIAALAQTIGWHPGRKVDELAARVDDLEVALAVAEAERDKALAALDALTALREPETV